MTVSWPISLPRCPLFEHEETASSPKVSFQPEVGPPIERLRGSLWLSEFPATFKMTSEQVATFETFVRQSIRGGTLPFTMRHPRTLADVTVRIAGDDQLYTMRRLGTRTWLVSFTVLVVST
ncbi:hypothetical protein [Aminobacter sp. BE322]|uniref:hypothetical protein n=1 Tax=unclassified Aminobacter TaxID=2644704 RepID=UPI003D23DC53